MALTRDEGLDRLGALAVRTGLGLREGQELLITAPLAAVPLVRRITEHAYRAGASLVTTFYSDDETRLARFRHGHEGTFDTAAGWMFDGMAAAYRNGAARLAITGDDPALLSGCNAEFVARASRAQSIAYRPALELITDFATNWSIVAAATPAWAAMVFPGLPQDEAVAALWSAIFAASRVDRDDPVAEWAAHNRAIHARRDALNAHRFAALRFHGPGTELSVGLADGHLWEGGAGVARNGITCNPNIPSEEVFTTPHCARVEGVVRSTKPLSYQGTLIDGIAVRFEAGRIVEAHADRGETVLTRVLATDAGACRLGEVALVAHSSPISKSGLLFGNTLFDENAASHIALGQAYRTCMQDADGLDDAALEARGANSSLIHIDWMIGSGEIDVDGVDADGTARPVMRAGEFVGDFAAA